MSDLIPVECFTNLDAYAREEWPDKLCCRPIPGDIVTSKGGMRLKVVRITHCQNHCHPGLGYAYYLRVELWRVGA